MNLCWKSGCYCKQGLLYDTSINECVTEEECGKHKRVDYYDEFTTEIVIDDRTTTDINAVTVTDDDSNID